MTLTAGKCVETTTHFEGRFPQPKTETGTGGESGIKENMEKRCISRSGAGKEHVGTRVEGRG